MSSKDRQIAELSETVARLEQKIASLSAACERGRVDTAKAQRCLNVAQAELMRHGHWVDSDAQLVSLCDYHSTKPGTEHVGIERCNAQCAWYYSPEEDWPSPDDRPLTVLGEDQFGRSISEEIESPSTSPRAASADDDSTTAAEIADRLLNFMGDISEEVYYAGWLIDLEFTLWAIAERVAPPGEVGEKQATELRELATKCSGWWRWDEAKGCVVFVGLSEWRRMVDERQAILAAQGAQ